MTENYIKIFDKKQAVFEVFDEKNKKIKKMKKKRARNLGKPTLAEIFVVF